MTTTTIMLPALPALTASRSDGPLFAAQCALHGVVLEESASHLLNALRAEGSVLRWLREKPLSGHIPAFPSTFASAGGALAPPAGPASSAPAGGALAPAGGALVLAGSAGTAGSALASTGPPLPCGTFPSNAQEDHPSASDRTSSPPGTVPPSGVPPFFAP